MYIKLKTPIGRVIGRIKLQVKIKKMKNHKITASIAIDEQGKIMGGVEIVPKPRPKTIIDQILESMKPTQMAAIEKVLKIPLSFPQYILH